MRYRFIGKIKKNIKQQLLYLLTLSKKSFSILKTHNLYKIKYFHNMLYSKKNKKIKKKNSLFIIIIHY